MNRVPLLLFRLGAILFVVAMCAPQVQPQEPLGLPALSADQIVARLMKRNEERAEALEHYTGHRRYRLEYEGFPGPRDAAMEMDASFDAPGSKRFTITGETGSKLILNRILRRLLECEQEANDAANQQRIALTNSNYSFSLAGIAGANYVLNVEPRIDSKFLYRGKIWVDGRDFAVTRIEAGPAKSPSFWATNSQIHETYEKVDNYFYLPRQNRTITGTRLGGIATLTIEYTSYVVTASPKTAAGVQAKFGSESLVGSSFVDLRGLEGGPR